MEDRRNEARKSGSRIHADWRIVKEKAIHLAPMG
jgi:hypothetical protein